MTRRWYGWRASTTTRIERALFCRKPLPDRPLVSRGPYRFVNHPNYLIVIAEIAVLPLAFGAAMVAAVFSAANLVLLARRVMIEERALTPRRQA